MTTHKEALTLALEALEEIALAGMSPAPEMIDSKEAFHARQAWRFIGVAARALEPIKEALAQEQEPVGYGWKDPFGDWYYSREKELDYITPLYTTPPQRKPLTDEQLEKGRDQTFSINNPFCPCDSKTFRKVARWVEAAHGIKGEA